MEDRRMITQLAQARANLARVLREWELEAAEKRSWRWIFRGAGE